MKSTIIKNANMDNSKNIKTVSKNTTLWIPLSFMLPALIFFGLFTLIPLFKIIKDSTGSVLNYSNAYSMVWNDVLWWQSMFNSLLFCIITVPISLMISLIVSYSLSNVVRKKLRGFWQSIFFIPYVTSAIAISITFARIFEPDQFGIFNWVFGTDIPWLETSVDNNRWIGLMAISVYGIWHNLAFQILILTTAMLSIDKRLYDSASIDGATTTKQFFSVTLPSVERTLWYLFTIGMITSLKVFPLALFNNEISDSMEYAPTLLVYIYQTLNSGTPNYEKAGAASVSLIFVVVIFNIVVKKGIQLLQLTIKQVKDNKLQKELETYEKIQMQEFDVKTHNSEINRKINELNEILNREVDK